MYRVLCTGVMYRGYVPENTARTYSVLFGRCFNLCDVLHPNNEMSLSLVAMVHKVVHKVAHKVVHKVVHKVYIRWYIGGMLRKCTIVLRRAGT